MNTVFNPVSAQCTYKPGTTDAWVYGQCGLGAGSDVFNNANGWNFTTRTGNPDPDATLIRRPPFFQPPDETSALILAPAPGSIISTPSVVIQTRVGKQADRGTFRAFLNGREITRLFDTANTHACLLTVCELRAVVSAEHGLVRGRNELRVTVGGPGAATLRSDVVTFEVR